MNRAFWVLLGTSVLWGSTARAKSYKYNLELTHGAGFDSNTSRVEPCTGFAREASALAYLTLDLDGAWTPSPGEALNLRYLIGGKIHFSEKAKGQDIIVNRLELGWSHLLTQKSFFRLAFSYLESNERSGSDPKPVGAESGTEQLSLPELMDFRFLNGEGALVFKLRSRMHVFAGVGVSRFVYFPDTRLGFTGVAAQTGLKYSRLWGKSHKSSRLDLTAAYLLQRNMFKDEVAVEGPSRRDTVHDISAKVSYLSTWLLSAGYSFRANLSNSPSWSVLRHVLTLKGTFGPFFKIMTVLKLTLQYVDYPEAVLLYAPALPESFQTLDQESRSSVLVSLQRPLARGYLIHLKYQFFVGTTVDTCDLPYMRHMVLAELVYSFSR